jgi:hypothetical protein
MGQQKSQSPVSVLALITLLLCLLPSGIHGQGRGAGVQPTASAKSVAPIDLTGYWVAEVTEDWRWRMVTPAKGDYQSIPITPEAQKVADAWDPKRDEAAGEQCKSYGAPALMRAPTRLNITWDDDNTLKVQSDYGMQTRILRFGKRTPAPGPATWQGDSVARWDVPQGRGTAAAPKSGSLVVSTTHLRPGYLRKNGVPYSSNTTMTEYWDLVKEQNGQERILLLIVVEDPVYLQGSWTVPVHFKKEPNGAKWDPTPCSSTW